jgi:hypothetical protein
MRLLIPHLARLMLPIAMTQGNIEADVQQPATMTDSGVLTAQSPRPEQIVYDPITNTMRVDY